MGNAGLGILSAVVGEWRPGIRCGEERFWLGPQLYRATRRRRRGLAGGQSTRTETKHGNSSPCSFLSPRVLEQVANLFSFLFPGPIFSCVNERDKNEVGSVTRRLERYGRASGTILAYGSHAMQGGNKAVYISQIIKLKRKDLSAIFFSENTTVDFFKNTNMMHIHPAAP